MAEIGNDIEKAKYLLEAGELVAIPTETVYGLAANALNEQAALKIFQVKNRPSFDPLISHVSGLDQLQKLAKGIPDIAYRLADSFWPGPLTMLLPKTSLVPDLITSGLARMAVRVPNHPVSLLLLEQLDFPLAAPSANPFGYVSPTTADHVNDQLGTEIAYILDGGPAAVGLESTIVGFENEKIKIHRLGGITLEQIEPFGPVQIDINQSSNPTAPGMLKSHYAPGKPVLMGDIDALVKAHDQKKIALISFQERHPYPLPQAVLSPAGDLAEAARNLFKALRAFDQPEIELIITENFPDSGLGRAINDRLRRAAAR